MHSVLTWFQICLGSYKPNSSLKHMPTVPVVVGVGENGRTSIDSLTRLFDKVVDTWLSSLIHVSSTIPLFHQAAFLCNMQIYHRFTPSQKEDIP